MSSTTLVEPDDTLMCKIEQIHKPLCDSYKLRRMVNGLCHAHRRLLGQFPEGNVDEQSEFRAGPSFKFCLDVAEFKPSELLVKVAGNCVTIEGKHAERIDAGGFIERDFRRRCFIPQTCDATNVSSTISPEGVLTIRAPKHTIETGVERIIGIRMEEAAPETVGETPHNSTADIVAELHLEDIQI